VRVFIVHAHPETASFNGAMTRRAVQALGGATHEVVVSDLYAMGFDPVSDRRNFVGVKDPVRFSQQDEESFASATDGYVPALQAEMDKLAWCTDLVLQFPLWWLGMPAILKGWIDRVFAVGRAYGGGRWFEGGVFAGKRAMCSVTVGGTPASYSDHGMYLPMSSVLYPIHRGILEFVGFTVLEPFIVFAPRRMSHDERVMHLARYEQRVLELPSTSRLGSSAG
jgi:NAD(P)H dehydrogenase (quinone)